MFPHLNIYVHAYYMHYKKNPHSLHHDAVYPHLSGASGVVKNVDPGESQRDHEEANVLSAATSVQDCGEEEKRRLQEAWKTERRVLRSLLSKI